MKSNLVLACACLSLLPATSVAVPTIYTYTGRPYTLIHDVNAPAGTYTTDMNLSGSITLMNAVPPNTATEFILGDSAEVLNFSFNDGRVEYPLGRLFMFTTDASGGIAQWHVELVDAPAGFAMARAWTVTGGDFASVSARNRESDRAQSIVPGTWTVTPIPEPETYALFLAGIAVVGFAAHRRIKLPT
jgi:hypothetical protein